MFYRLRFDAYVGAILKRCSYDTSAALDFWPVGATPEWVHKGQACKRKPVEAAAIAVAEIALGRVRAGQMTNAEGQYVATMATQIARENGANPEILTQLSFLAWNDIPHSSKPK